jgi:hypothetical protein
MHDPRSFLRCALAAALVSFVSLNALAAPSPKERAQAKTLVEKARKALKEKKFSDALGALTEASKLDPGPMMEVELANAEAASGKLVAASKRLTAVVTSDGDDASAKAARDAAKSAIGDLAARIPSVKVVVRGGAAAAVTIDGQEASVSSDESVDPGEHAIVVIVDGKPPIERKVTVAEGAHETVDIDPEGGASEGAPSGPSKLGPLLPGIVVTSVGGASLLVGAILGGLAIGATSDAKKGCAGNVCADTPERRDQIDKARTLGNASTGLLVAGGVIAAGGVVLLVLKPFSKKKDDAPKGAHVTPWIGLDQVGVMGTF